MFWILYIIIPRFLTTIIIWETCSETPSNHDPTPTTMTVRETGSGKRDHDGGSTDDVERVTSRVQTRSTRPTAGDTTSERQRLVRQEEAATRHRHSRRRCVNDVRPHNSLRRTVLMATHVNGSTSARSLTTPVDTQSAAAHTRTAARQLARPATPTHTRTHSPTHSPTTSLTTIGLLSFTHSAQLLELNSIYTVSRLHDRLTVY